jgi:hypothetical protein
VKQKRKNRRKNRVLFMYPQPRVLAAAIANPMSTLGQIKMPLSSSIWCIRCTRIHLRAFSLCKRDGQSVLEVGKLNCQEGAGRRRRECQEEKRQKNSTT